MRPSIPQLACTLVMGPDPSLLNTYIPGGMYSPAALPEIGCLAATARTMKPAEDPDVLTIEGDIADPATADRIISGALQRFGRIDTLINNAGVYVSKPFTDYAAGDYARVVGVNLGGFFWLTQRAIAEMLKSPTKTSGPPNASSGTTGTTTWRWPLA
jgi:NAD(P)-dependent dehydrogenase (short-subunit alcohol dehydrogenase family)